MVVNGWMKMAGRKKKVEPVEAVTLADLLGMENEPTPALVEEAASKKLSPFDFLNAINYSKENLIVDEETEKQYQPYLVNRGLSNSMDTVIYANEMNSRPHIEKKAQFAFLRRVVTKRKRYDKWVKAEVVENLDLVKEAYGYNDAQALEALTILTPAQFEYIRNTKGGSRA
jgi:hypothetical protein